MLSELLDDDDDDDEIAMICQTSEGSNKIDDSLLDKLEIVRLDENLNEVSELHEGESVSPTNESNEEDEEVVFVDEAAIFPVHLLSQLLGKTSRIVFSTTTSGYEGTGQGFRLRFDPILREMYPERRCIRLDTPVRWQPNDPVEAWINRALCLEPTSDRFIENNDPIVVSMLDRDELVNDPRQLEIVFSLLVRAHHRTAPSDLQRLLDSPNIRLWTARAGGHLVGVCMVAQEGQLDDAVIQTLFEGKRRPRGHLLSETLVAHAGMPHHLDFFKM